MNTIYGTSLDFLGNQIAEHFNPGAKVQLDLSIGSLLDSGKLAVFQEHLLTNGFELTKPVQSLITEEGPVVRVEFVRPDSQSGVGVIPLILLIPAGLAAIGIFAVMGWRISQVTETIAKYVIPLSLGILAIVFLPKIIREFRAQSSVR